MSEKPNNEKTKRGTRTFNVLVRFRSWCEKERVGRVEEGTSQDMCPTNGDALLMTIIMWVAWTPLAVVLIMKLN